MPGPLSGMPHVQDRGHLSRFKKVPICSEHVDLLAIAEFNSGDSFTSTKPQWLRITEASPLHNDS